MQIQGYLIHKERQKLGWSLESLGHGICSASYLSKIETGRTEASDETIQLLMNKMGIQYYSMNECSCWMEEQIKELFDTMKHFEEEYFDECRQKIRELKKYEYSPWYIQIRLLETLYSDRKPLDEDVEPFMNNEDYAWQLVLKKKYMEARRIKSYIVFYLFEGIELFKAGQYLQAIEPLTITFQSASLKGLIHLMLHSSLYLGNVYSCEGDLESMCRQYTITKRIARAMKNTDFEEYIGYNEAYALLEQGNVEEAWKYFGKEHPVSPLFLHKKAICLEKMGEHDQAWQTLNQAYDLLEKTGKTAENARDISAEDCRLMLDIVRMRLEDPEGYLEDDQYGELLLEGYDRFYNNLPAGFARFHIPWVIEWYKSHRMYRDLCSLYSQMSHFSRMFPL